MHDPEYKKFTLEEYWKLLETFPERKYEYVDGYIRMMTGGSAAHAHIQARIATLLTTKLEDSECIAYGPDAIFQLSEKRSYCPDASVSCDPYDWTRKKIEAPTVVVEILSPSTEALDKGEKLDAYQQYPTIYEILLIDSRRRYVKHYHRVSVTEWQCFIYQQDDDIIDISSIEVKISVREIYLKVYLELEE